MNTIKLNKVDSDYAWAVCSCGNTVKFNLIDAETVCAACGKEWFVPNSGDDEAIDKYDD